MAKQRRRSSGKKGGKITVDFSDVKDFKTSIPEDKYIVKIKTVQQTVSSNKNPQLEIDMIVSEGKEKGFTFKHWVSLSEAALYRLKQLFDAFGMEYKATGKFGFDPQDLVGLEAIAQMFNETTEGKTRSKVASFYPIDGEYDDDEDDDYDDYEDDDYEDDDYEDDDYEDDDDDLDVEEELSDLDKEELVEVAKELEISSKAIKKAKNKKALIKLIMKEDEDEIAEVLEGL